MEKKRLKLPAGIQTFEKLRNENCVYVDKTKYLIDLIEEGSAYFLSRPRRFGKSLTVTTLDALFSGKKELFKGLYAENFLNSHNFKPSPVIRLDMSSIDTYCGTEVIIESIKHKTITKADDIGVEIDTNLSCGDMLGMLIKKTAQKYDSKVVVLIDEYDKPFTDFVDNHTKAEEIRTLLKNYYSQLKASDEYISFIFITGIAKFTRMGIFSTLNNLTDISPMEKYNEICGLTQEEIIKYFPDYIEETAIKNKISTNELVEKMKNYYNGFCFDETGKTRLYNPFSTISFFSHQNFINFWFESGTPSMIAKYIKTQKVTVEQFRNYPVTLDFIYNSVEIEKALPENFLFQTGYLSFRKTIDNKLFLDYPNTEVLNAMSALISENILNIKNEYFSYSKTNLILAIEDSNFNLFKETLNILLASIPYDDYSRAAKQNILINKYKYPAIEWLYRSTIFAYLRGCNIDVSTEMHTSLGRPDIVIKHYGKVWIIEIKVAYKNENPKQKAEEALHQIIEKDYAKPYPNAICIGIAIDDTKREIAEVITSLLPLQME